SSSDEAWYQSIGVRLRSQIQAGLSELPDVPPTTAGWRDLLCAIASRATTAGRPVAIALDEVGSLGRTGPASFFSVLRAVFNSRTIEPWFENLTFILAGAFRPSELIKDSRISPFNVAHRVRLPDLTSEQVRQLAAKGRLVTPKVIARILFWTSGQVYMTS